MFLFSATMDDAFVRMPGLDNVKGGLAWIQAFLGLNRCGCPGLARHLKMAGKKVHLFPIAFT
jgi:hypothetical protein